MEIIYYPSEYVSSEETLKSLLLCWGKVTTVVPPREMDYIKRYLQGEIKNEIHYPLEMYKKVLDMAGEPVVDFMVVNDKERRIACEKMFDVVINWNKDTRFFDSLRINSLEDLMGKWIHWHWFLHEELEWPLVQLLLEERLLVNWAPSTMPVEIVGQPEVGNTYSSIIAEVIKEERGIRLLTDDEFAVAAKSSVGLGVAKSGAKHEAGYQVVSMAIPQVFLSNRTLKMLSWPKILKIRTQLAPYAENYHLELERYQKSINSLLSQGKDEQAFSSFCEFCEHSAQSFKPFAKEISAILKLTKITKKVAFITDVVLPTAKLAIPDPILSRVFDVAAITSSYTKYFLSRAEDLTGFAYLENLNRKLEIERFKGVITCIIPRKVKEMLSLR